MSAVDPINTPPPTLNPKIRGQIPAVPAPGGAPAEVAKKAVTQGIESSIQGEKYIVPPPLADAVKPDRPVGINLDRHA